eukprot:4760121-Amphidinium_carterae.3
MLLSSSTHATCATTTCYSIAAAFVANTVAHGVQSVHKQDQWAWHAMAISALSSFALGVGPSMSISLSSAFYGELLSVAPGFVLKHGFELCSCWKKRSRGMKCVRSQGASFTAVWQHLCDQVEVY